MKVLAHFHYSQIEVVDLRNGPEGDDMTEQIFKL